MSRAEFMVLDVLKLRAATLGKAVKKSELLRAGIKALLLMIVEMGKLRFVNLQPKPLRALSVRQDARF